MTLAYRISELTVMSDSYIPNASTLKLQIRGRFVIFWSYVVWPLR